MSATCHVAKEQLEVLPGRSPLGVVLSSARQDAAVIAAVWRHRHECHVPRCRGAARGAARLKPTRRGAKLHSRRCRVEGPLGATQSPVVGTATIVAAWRHHHECHVLRYRGAGRLLPRSKTAWCDAKPCSRRSEKILEFRTRFYLNDPCDVSISNNSKMYTQLYSGTEQMYTHLNQIDRVLFIC